MAVTTREANVFMFYSVTAFCWDSYFIARQPVSLFRDQRGLIEFILIFIILPYFTDVGALPFIHVLQVSNSQQLDFCFKVDVLLFSLLKKKKKGDLEMKGYLIINAWRMLNPTMGLWITVTSKKKKKSNLLKDFKMPYLSVIFLNNKI